MQKPHRINPIGNSLKRLAPAGFTARIASALAALALIPPTLVRGTRALVPGNLHR